MFAFMKSQANMKMDHVGSKSRSIGQILEKLCVRSGDHIFSPIIMKLGQNVCHDETSDKIEIQSCVIKN